MRKVLFAAVASSVVLAVAPAVAFAHSHSHRHRGHHGAHRTHERVRDEYFGRNDENSAPSNSAQNAGTVASFHNGVLMLALNDGSMVSGQVTDATEIKCEAVESQEMEHNRHADGDHGRGRNGGDDNGDDNGKNDDVQGEDEHGAHTCSSAHLVRGIVVRDAELTISGAGAIWQEVELAEQNR
jgi:hypothetical protein